MTNRASLAFAASQRADVVGKPYWEAVCVPIITPGLLATVREAVKRAADER